MSIPPETIPVAVVIPCFRCKDVIPRAVKSVERQTALPAEIILVDDCSEDGTLEALKGIAARYPAGWVKVVALKRNGGPGSARNAGWEAASAAYVAFLDADDAWHPRKLEIQHGWMQAHPHASICGHGTTVLSDPPRFPDLSPSWSARRIGKLKIFFFNSLPLRSVMLRRDLPLRFAPDQFHAEDYFLWMHAILTDRELWRLPLRLACSFKPDFGARGLSARLWAMERGELQVYRALYRESLAPAWLLSAATAFSFLKFLRRCVISMLWSWRKPS